MVTLTEPTEPARLGRVATACALTPTPDTADVPACPLGVTLASAFIVMLDAVVGSAVVAVAATPDISTRAAVPPNDAKGD